MVWIHREDNLHSMDLTYKATDLEQTQLSNDGEAAGTEECSKKE